MDLLDSSKYTYHNNHPVRYWINISICMKKFFIYAALLALRYPSVVSGDSLGQPYTKCFLLQLRSLPHRWCPTAGSRLDGPTGSLKGHQQAPMTFPPQPRAATSTIEALNKADSDSMSPTSPKGQEKFLQRWELKTLRTGSPARRSQQTLSACVGLPGLSGSLPHHLIQLTTRWW